MIIYDVEITRPVRPRDGETLPGIDYCESWQDFEHMGIACVCTYDTERQLPQVWFEEDVGRLGSYLIAWIGPGYPICGFNNHSFDDRLLAHHGVEIPRAYSYDLLVEVWRGAGLGPEFEYPSHAGFGLDALARRNLADGKVLDCTNAAVLWQQGQRGRVVRYCLHDVALTWRLMRLAMYQGYLGDPREDTVHPIEVRMPLSTTHDA